MSDVKLPEYIETIKYDAIIDIKVSGHFYKRIRKLFDNYCITKSPDDFKKALERIKSNNVGKDVFTIDIETILIIIAQIEKDGMTQGKISKVPLPKS